MREARLRSPLGFPVLLALIGAIAVYIGLTADRYLRGQNRALAQELVIHHFERSSCFAMNAGKYEGIDPDLASRFRESAAWHAHRAREFQRMSTGDVARESERDAEHDDWDARLLERAFRCDSLLKTSDRATAKPERHEGKARDTAP